MLYVISIAFSPGSTLFVVPLMECGGVLLYILILASASVNLWIPQRSGDLVELVGPPTPPYTFVMDIYRKPRSIKIFCLSLGR